MPGIGRTYKPLCATARGQMERRFDWNREHAESKPTQPSFSVMPRLAGSTFGAHTPPGTGPAPARLGYACIFQKMAADGGIDCWWSIPASTRAIEPPKTGGQPIGGPDTGLGTIRPGAWL
jgi:hypothetical protein